MADQAKPTPKPADHLAGPWAAILSHQGESYPDMRTALIELGQDGEVDISVRRGTALAHEDDDGYLPSSYATGDVAYELDDVYLVDPDDPSVGAEARFAQALAMAAGLNAAQPKCTPACDALQADPTKATGLDRSFHANDCLLPVHHHVTEDGVTECGISVADLFPAHGYGSTWAAVDCRPCLSAGGA